MRQAAVWRRDVLALPLAAVACLPACALTRRAAVVPMPVLAQPVSPDRQAPVLAVMLPGAYSAPREFIDEGVITALRSQRFDVDALVADAHLGYMENGSMLERLRDDVLLPARSQGYRRIWLVGISLGGLASLGLLRQHDDLIEGILTIAPYLGRPELVQQVAAAGGAGAFAVNARDAADLEAGLWIWLARSSPALRDKIHLYTGSQDRFIEGHRLLAALLPSDHVLELPGRHDWPVWRALWLRWLTKAPWPRVAALQG